MEYKINDEHVYLLSDDGRLLGNVDFRESSPHVFNIEHTVVLPELRGQGIAGKLVAKTIEEIHRRGGKVTASCEYAQAWMERHPMSQDETASDEAVAEISQRLIERNKGAYGELAK